MVTTSRTITKAITDNPYERIDIKWDGERFAIVANSASNPIIPTRVIILSIAEAGKVYEFIKEMIKHV